MTVAIAVAVAVILVFFVLATRRLRHMNCLGPSGWSI